MVKEWKDGVLSLELKNKFLKGQVLDCLQPKQEPFLLTADEMFDEKGNALDSAPHPMMTVKIPCDRPVAVGSLLRMKAE